MKKSDSDIMRRSNYYIVFTLSFAFLCITGKLHAGAMKPFVAEVVKVIDGDSLKVRKGKKNYEIRLYGIDAPEFDQPFAGKAKKFVKKAILGKKVEIIPVEKDKYQRLVAIVGIGDETINYELLSHGLAWYYPKYCKKRICSSWKKVSKSARKKNKNIWSDASPISPWKWKYYKHKRQ